MHGHDLDGVGAADRRKVEAALLILGRVEEGEEGEQDGAPVAERVAVSPANVAAASPNASRSARAAAASHSYACTNANGNSHSYGDCDSTTTDTYGNSHRNANCDSTTTDTDGNSYSHSYCYTHRNANGDTHTHRKPVWECMPPASDDRSYQDSQHTVQFHGTGQRH